MSASTLSRRSLLLAYTAVTCGLLAVFSDSDIFFRIGFFAIILIVAISFWANEAGKTQLKPTNGFGYLLAATILFLFFSAVSFFSQEKIILSYFAGGSATFIAPFIVAWYLCEINQSDKIRIIKIMGIGSVFMAILSALFLKVSSGERPGLCNAAWVSAIALSSAYAWGILKNTWGSIAFSTLTFVCTLFSGSRIMIVISFVLFISGIIFHSAPSTLYKLIVNPRAISVANALTCFVIAILAGVYCMSNPSFIDNIYSISRLEYTIKGAEEGGDEAMQGRNAEIPSIVNEMKMNWSGINYILGSGHGAHFKNVYPDEMAIGGDRLHNVHYSYIGAYFRYGIVGIFIMGLYWFAALRSLWRYLSKMGSSTEAIIALASIGVLIRCTVENGMRIIESPIILAILLTIFFQERAHRE